MKLAYVTTYDGRDIRHWSGTGFYMGEALRAQVSEFRAIGPLQEGAALVPRAKQLLQRACFQRNYLRDRDPAILKHYARQVARRLGRFDADVVFSPGTIPIAHLETPARLAFWTDATFAGFLNYAKDFDTRCPEFTDICAESIHNGHSMERAILERCAVAIYSSEWAAQTAIRHYGVSPHKVRVVPFGANMNCHHRPEDIDDLLEARRDSPCKLLFVGARWSAKGGDVAVEVARKLNRAGLPTELTLVGSSPEDTTTLMPWVRSMGVISKATDDGQAELARLFAEAHFLVLPTRADCTPIVLSEANAFALPCLTSNIGGIPTIIKDEVNGKLFPLEDIDGYVRYIQATFADRRRYRELARSAFNEYQTRLNWRTAGKRVRAMLQEV